MNLINALKDAGFSRIIILDASECGVEEAGSVLLGIWPYQAELPDEQGAWIHPYYHASQMAYMAAAAIARSFAEEGIQLRVDIRVKPIFARLPGFSQGQNTLSYTQEYGSRFHVQIFTSMTPLPATHHLEAYEHDLHCHGCRNCIEACPTNALEGGRFHRERCLRNWMLNGQSAPDFIREHMSNMLIGCDVCQRVCPHNAPPVSASTSGLPLSSMLAQPRETALELRSVLGANLAIPNRLLAQACLIAGNSSAPALIQFLQPLCSHPSPTVADHAKWAVQRLTRVHHDA